MKRNILKVIAIFCFLLVFNEVSAQTQGAYFKSTTKKLINYLQHYDTASIHNLFDEDKRYYDLKDDIKSDSRLLTTIINKYGVQVLDSMVIEKGENDENVVVVTLLNTPDSSLNIKKCELVVFFYPDRFLSYSQKVLNYIVVKTFLKEPEKKLIRLNLK